MPFRLICLTCALALMSPGTTPAKPHWIVSPTGIGAMKIGMTRKQLSTAVQEHLAGPGLGDTADCYYTEAKTYPGVALMILQGKLARIDVAATGTTTEERIGVGDSERHVLAVYGTRGRVTPNAYDSTDDIVTVLSADKKTGFKFVMDEKKVRLIYAGRADALEFIEGCE